MPSLRKRVKGKKKSQGVKVAVGGGKSFWAHLSKKKGGERGGKKEETSLSSKGEVLFITSQGSPGGNACGYSGVFFHWKERKEGLLKSGLTKKEGHFKRRGNGSAQIL